METKIRKLKIEVTQKHIEEAKRNRRKPTYDSLTQCMVAVALRDHFPNAYCGVATWRENEKEGLTGFLPDEVSTKIEAFCQGKKVSPFTFDLDVPEEVGR